MQSRSLPQTAQRAQRTQRRSEFKPVDTIYQSLNVEVEQQASPDPGQFHIRQQLGLVNAADLVDGLQLQNEPVVHQHVDAVSTIRRFRVSCG